MARNNAGQIIKRGERTYQLRVDMGTNPDTGKRNRITRTVHMTRKEAQKVLNEMLRAKDMGTLKNSTQRSMSLNSYLDQWLETAAKPRLSARSYSDYKWLMKCYVRPKLGKRQLTQISPLDIQMLYGEMQNAGLSSRSVRYTHSVLRNALDQAVQWGMATTNPAAKADLPRKEHQEMQAMTQEEANRFLAAAAEGNLHLLFTLLLVTGLRPAEAAGLKWSDLDLESKKLSVRRTVTRPRGGGWTFSKPKTPQSRRSMDIPDSLVVMLQEHQSESQAREHNLVFQNVNGEPLYMPNVSRRNFKRVLERAGLSSSFRLYDLRHTCATLLMLGGHPPKVVSERLGHSSYRETMDTYSHVLPSMQKQASDTLEAMLFGEDEPTEKD